MPDDYTPTTEEVREHWRSGWHPRNQEAADASFDAWLAGLIAEKRAEWEAEQGARLLPDPKGGCACDWHSQDAGGGYTEILAEYEPSCPEHSGHVYNPRTGVWELAEQGETEWEYGIRTEGDDVPLGVSPMPTLEAAQARANNIYGGWVIIRRRKAGAWAPVKENEATDRSER